MGVYMSPRKGQFYGIFVWNQIQMDAKLDTIRKVGICSGDATVRLFLQSCCCLLIKWCCEFHMKSECSVSPRDRRWRRSIEARWRLTKMSQCICWHDLIRTVTVIDYHLSTAAAVVRGIINGRHGASNPRHAEKRGRKSIKTQTPRLIRPV